MHEATKLLRSAAVKVTCCTWKTSTQDKNELIRHRNWLILTCLLSKSSQNEKSLLFCVPTFLAAAISAKGKDISTHTLSSDKAVPHNLSSMQVYYSSTSSSVSRDNMLGMIILSRKNLELSDSHVWGFVVASSSSLKHDFSQSINPLLILLETTASENFSKRFCFE